MKHCRLSLAVGLWLASGRAKLTAIFGADGFALIREDASPPQDSIYLLKRRPTGKN
jgi:hypothetical protein